MAYPKNHDRMFLTCYTDTFGYGWHHVDLFVHDENDLEVNWVHWGVDQDGPRWSRSCGEHLNGSTASAKTVWSTGPLMQPGRSHS